MHVALRPEMVKVRDVALPPADGVSVALIEGVCTALAGQSRLSVKVLLPGKGKQVIVTEVVLPETRSTEVGPAFARMEPSLFLARAVIVQLPGTRPLLL